MGSFTIYQVGERTHLELADGSGTTIATSFTPERAIQQAAALYLHGVAGLASRRPGTHTRVFRDERGDMRSTVATALPAGGWLDDLSDPVTDPGLAAMVQRFRQLAASDVAATMESTPAT
jgi:hypothetical protein